MNLLSEFRRAPFGRGEKTPTPKISALLRKRPVLLSGPISSLLRSENGLTMDIFVVKCTGRGLVEKRPGVLSKVQMLNLVLGVGVFSLFPNLGRDPPAESLHEVFPEFSPRFAVPSLVGQTLHPPPVALHGVATPLSRLILQ